MTNQEPAKTTPQTRKVWKMLYQFPPPQSYTLLSEVIAIGTKPPKSGKMAQNTT